MTISTLEALQSLTDSEFHALGDELLPRISSNYHPVVPFGRNAAGDSIRGQPDSYVGDTAKACRIAIQYTIADKSWWLKLIDDVRVARQQCPLAQEIVVVLPRDIDRQKPKKGKGIGWYDEATRAAAPAKLTLIHGRKIEQQLDTTCQDLRFHYLRIPFSRLSWHALMAGCRESTAINLKRLSSLKRYEPERYVDREADNRLFGLWQDALRLLAGRSTSSGRRTLIPIVADSGIGKTSLFARFAERTSPHSPVLLVLARDLCLDKSDALTAHVMERLQGFIDGTARSIEESHLVTLLAGKTPLTVVLDGLDEATNAVSVRKIIDAWIWSRLGKSAVLVSSSRPEFWRNCRDATWSSAITVDENPKVRKSLRHERELSTLDPMQGIELPGKFSPQELAEAWKRGGQCEDELWQLPADVREELGHPFTLRSALDLRAKGTSLQRMHMRSAILDMWIQNRLQAEGDARNTERQYRDCLLAIARKAALNEGGWVPVDELKTVPRFDATKPPGAAVERLIAANILETHPHRPDQIRFSIEAVFDFFLAESVVLEIEHDPEKVAMEFASLPFSKAVTRLERIGDYIAAHSYCEKFVKSLAELDAAKAAVVLRSNVNEYSSVIRELVVSKVGELLTSRFEAEQALATELLGRLKCDESRHKLESFWTVNAVCKRVHPLVSRAAITHGIVSLVPHVFQTWWFETDHYFVDLRPELIASTQDFRTALAEFASKYIASETHSEDYRRALMILAYLKDERAVSAIKKRTQNKVPYFYESLCLLAIGSRQAVEVYSSIVDRYIAAHAAAMEKEDREKWWDGAIPHAQIANLATGDVEQFVCDQIDSDNVERQLIGRFLARWIKTERLLLYIVKRWNIDGYTHIGEREFGRHLGAENWLRLWQEANTLRDRKALIEIASDLRDTRTENILIEHVDVSELGGYCAQSLAFIGSQRACPAIRRLLAKGGESNRDIKWHREMAFRALARLRDPASVPELVRYLEDGDGVNIYNGTIGLASIGTEEAETALLQLKNQSDELLVRGLMHYGSGACIERAVEIAKQRDGDIGAEWLVKQCRFSLWGLHGKSTRQYRTDVAIEPFLDFVLERGLTAEVCEHLRSIVADVDSPSVRRLLRDWYDHRNSPSDWILKPATGTKLSDFAFRELAHRGDAHVLTAYIENELERQKKYRLSGWLIECLGYFDRTAVRSTLRRMLPDYPDNESRNLILDLIGHMGDESDIGELQRFQESRCASIANAAFEAKLRLTDPMRLAEHW
jgi:hypothetical protein